MSMSGAATLQPGFADPVLDAQRGFRSLLDASARPGSVHELPPAPRVGALPPAATALCLTLADFETRLWLQPALRGPAENGWLDFHCGCRYEDDPADADLALSAATRTPLPDAFCWGDELYPDRSTTLALLVDGLSAGAAPGATRLTLRGPGIDGDARLAVAGPAAGFWRALRASRAAFPRGVDVFLLCGDRVAALPRSVAFEFEAE